LTRSDRWIVIHGASSGFGAAAARAFAAEGHPIFGVHMDRRGAMPQVDALRGELQGHGVPVSFVNGNAADDDQRASAIAQLREAMGSTGTVGVLMHSLAFGTLRPYFDEEGAPERSTPVTMGRRHLDMTLDVMAHSLVYWTQDLVRHGLLRAGGRVYAMTSAGSLAAWPAYGAVSAAKCALESHVRQLAIELATRDITANAIMAGVTRTPALDRIPGVEELAASALARNPHGRLTRPEDVARCLLELSRPGTSWMTGNVIRVDGGESISG
jgi:NAD(P)-dependent dehydrogenase (short-subunit alcohol dehydrogenase family)